MLPQTPEEGGVFRCVQNAARACCVQSDGEERGDLDFFHHFFVCVCEGFPTSGKLKRQCAGAVGMQLWLCSFGWWGRWCSLCPIVGVGGMDPVLGIPPAQTP